MVRFQGAKPPISFGFLMLLRQLNGLQWHQKPTFMVKEAIPVHYQPFLPA